MPMTSLSLISGGTPSIAGGATKTYTPNNKPVANGISLIDASVTDFRLRPSLIATFRSSQQIGPSSFTKNKVTFFLKIPKLKADGTYVSNIGRLELEFDPETSTPEQDDLAFQTAQLAFDADTTSFRRTGSTVA